ncbi:hypothetical protein A3L09_01815 [Thermococcus profundus]|uniref:Glycosyltransferase 2-like domain-containing protein n=1 Tax=Thermococcus profundus TaxID=49899 RepID=A0A2Z2M6R6_THEPR|nr:glycosyltransferase family 2 protein [Thermococcus profundus]ASJ02090.1 hypothetical protein A3L09_01815 [Thermococcus profundus]
MKPRISVVVCTKNSESTLDLTLSSISRLNPFEIIIIDGGSKDKTLEIAKKYTRRIYSDNGKGLAYARQMGAVLARGDYVLYLDSDVEVNDPLFFERLLGEMERRNWIAVHPQVKSLSKNGLWEDGVDFYFSMKFNIPGEHRYLPLMACMIKRDVLLEISFDVRFKGAGEDHDFWARAFQNGYRFGVARCCWVFHHHRSSFKEFVKQRIWYGRGNVLLFSKYRD